MTTAIALDDLVRQAAERLARRRGAAVVGAVLGEETSVHGADPETVFEIGSVTKTFTALTLAKLAVRGAVALDRPLRDLLPDGTAVPERDGKAVELVHLACHTSGLPRLPKGLMPGALLRISDPYAGCTAEFILEGLGRTKLRSVPGSRFRYSNLGAGLLGLALARHAGTDYETLVRTEIAEPLGLTDTRVELDAARAARLAPGHTRTGRARPRWNLAALAGAGGLVSTVPDLLRFARAQFADAAGVPSDLAEAVALTRASSHPINAGRAAVHPGWISLRPPRNRRGPRVFFHNGGTGGYRSILAVAPERHAAVAVLSATTRSVDRPGLDLLAKLTRS